MALTNEERQKKALEEVQHLRPSGVQTVTTLQLDHPSFDEPARVVADNENLTATIEDGTEVLFKAVAFRGVGPAQSENKWPEIEMSIDGATGVLEPYLDQSLESDEPIIVTFREYVRDRAMDGPGRVTGGLELDRTSADDLTISGTAGFYGLDVKFGKTYDPSDFPGVG